MPETKPTILVVDDEPFNLKLIVEQLKSEPYRIIVATSGEEAWSLLEKTPEDFYTVLLDRIMSGIDGMEVLHRMKKHKALKSVPVIFQTAKNRKDEILEGLNAGAYYYLTKPFENETLLAVVKTAVKEHTDYKALRQEVNQTTDALKLLRKGCFEFVTIDQGKTLATLLARMCPEPQKTVLGLWELLINAVEHGNLGVTYEEKSALNESNTWHQEIQRRLALPENARKKVTVEVAHQDDAICFLITDQGEGFDWQPFLELSPDRVFDNHGRGIAMAGIQSFTHIEYRGKGNQVAAVVGL